jgi:small subunit ribosomal protein S5
LNGQSVPHEQKVNLVVRVFLIPASHGTGVIAGGAVRSVLESVGFTMYYLNLKDHQILTT